MDWKFPTVIFSRETMTFLFNGSEKRLKTLAYFTLNSAWTIYALF